MLRKYCKKCKKELAYESKYLVCKNCHLEIILLQDNIGWYTYLLESGRLWSLIIQWFVGGWHESMNLSNSSDTSAKDPAPTFYNGF